MSHSSPLLYWSVQLKKYSVIELALKKIELSHRRLFRQLNQPEADRHDDYEEENERRLNRGAFFWHIFASIV